MKDKYDDARHEINVLTARINSMQTTMPTVHHSVDNGWNTVNRDRGNIGQSQHTTQLLNGPMKNTWSSRQQNGNMTQALNAPRNPPLANPQLLNRHMINAWSIRQQNGNMTQENVPRNLPHTNLNLPNPVPTGQQGIHRPRPKLNANENAWDYQSCSDQIQNGSSKPTVLLVGNSNIKGLARGINRAGIHASAYMLTVVPHLYKSRPDFHTCRKRIVQARS